MSMIQDIQCKKLDGIHCYVVLENGYHLSTILTELTYTPKKVTLQVDIKLGSYWKCNKITVPTDSLSGLFDAYNDLLNSVMCEVQFNNFLTFGYDWRLDLEREGYELVQIF